MSLRAYIAHNVRHYRARTAEVVDCVAVRLTASSQYAGLDVPPWRSTQRQTLVAPSSVLSRLLGSATTAVADADRVLGGEMRLFACTIRTAAADVDGPAAPDWHRDHFSGHVFPVKPHPAYTIEENTGVDVIAAWELSRLQFVPALVQAYRETGDRRYADRFFELVEHWSSANPYRLGVNWMCGLDIAIRACNLAIGLLYLDELVPDRRRDAMRRLLWSHLHFLHHHDLFEPRVTVNNHLLIAAALQAGLLTLFEGPSAGAWQRAAVDIVEAESARQFLADGGNYESALMYHQFVLESLFLSTALMTPEQGDATPQGNAAFGESVCQVMRRATCFTRDYLHAWGAVPALGDSSDGRVLMHRDYFAWEPADGGYLVDWSRALFGQEDPFAVAAPAPWTCVHPSAGLAMHRGRGYALILSAMPVARRAGGHNHLDKASLLLRVGGCPVFVDSGTYCYTHDLRTRNGYRQSRAHNLLMLDGQDQAVLPARGAFSVPDFGALGVSLDGEDPVVLRAWHSGYQRLPGLGVTTRSVCCKADEVLIEDEVQGEGEHLVELVFNLAPGLSATLTREGVQVSRGQEVLCRIGLPGPEWQADVERMEVSAAYRVSCEAVRVVLRARLLLPAKTTVLVAILAR